MAVPAPSRTAATAHTVKVAPRATLAIAPACTPIPAVMSHLRPIRPSSAPAKKLVTALTAPNVRMNVGGSPGDERGEEHDHGPVRPHVTADRLLGGGGERGGARGPDRVEPAVEDGVTETVADQLPGFGDADVNGPFLDVDAGEPGLAGRGCHARPAAKDRHGRGLELGVPARDLPACGPGHGVDPVAGLTAAVVAEDGGEYGATGAGDPAELGEPRHGVGEVVEHERGDGVVDRAVGERKGADVGHGGGWPGGRVPGQHAGRQVRRQRPGAPCAEG